MSRSMTNSIEYKSPGLFLKGLETETIPPLLSGITGFVGISEKGPLNVPQPIKNWSEYLEVFGSFVSYSYLAESVYAFFLNGGEECYVVRTADLSDLSSENIPGGCKRVDLLQKARNVEPIKDEDGNIILRLEAINEGSWGNSIKVEINSESSLDFDLTYLTETTKLTDKTVKVGCVYDFKPEAQVWITHIDNPFIKKCYTIKSIDEDKGSITFIQEVKEIFPKESMLSGRGFKISFIYKDIREIFDNMSMNPDSSHYFVNMINGDPSVSEYIEKKKNGNSILVTVEHVLKNDGGRWRSGFKPVSRPNETDSKLYSMSRGGDGFIYAQGRLKDIDNNDSIIVISKEKGSEGNSTRILAAGFSTETALRIPMDSNGEMNKIVVEDIDVFDGNEKLTIISNDDPSKTVENVPVDSIDKSNHILNLGVNLPNEYPAGSRIEVPGRFNIIIKKIEEGDPLEIYYNLSMDDSDERYFMELIKKESKYICVERASQNTNPPANGILLSGGKNPSEIDYHYYTGYTDEGAEFKPQGNDDEYGPLGLSALEIIDEVSLVSIPDLDWTLPGSDGEESKKADFIAGQKHILQHCMKMGERFALLDSMSGTILEDIIQWPPYLSNTKISRFGALYYPWLFCKFDNNEKIVPPSGFIAGAIAKSDSKDGINKAPANMKLKGAFDLEFYIDKTDQDELNPIGINCIRKFEDGTIKLWGARTLSPEQTWIYINTRRVLLYIIKILSRKLLWAVFEPNSSTLWKRIESTLNSFFLTVLSKGMTASDKPEEAFYVKCNEETNTNEIIDSGMVLAEVGVAILYPAEFILITVRKTPESLSLIEEDI